VSLSVSGLPANATASFSPSSIMTSGSSTMTISVGTTAPTGTYNLTITGTSGILIHTAKAVLSVQTAGSSTIIPQSGWSLLYVDSQETVCGNYGAVNSFDGNPAKFWHTQWCPSAPSTHARFRSIWEPRTASADSPIYRGRTAAPTGGFLSTNFTSARMA
jgi:hypothetical protein